MGKQSSRVRDLTCKEVATPLESDVGCASPALLCIFIHKTRSTDRPIKQPNTSKLRFLHRILPGQPQSAAKAMDRKWVNL